MKANPALDLVTLCLAWLIPIEVKEFLISQSSDYTGEILGAGFTFPDLFTLPLLSLFLFEPVMPGCIDTRYELRLLAPFLVLGTAYGIGLLSNPARFIPRSRPCSPIYPLSYPRSADRHDVQFPLLRIRPDTDRRLFDPVPQRNRPVPFVHRTNPPAPDASMSALQAFYLFSYILIIVLTGDIYGVIASFVLTLSVWGILYACIT